MRAGCGRLCAGAAHASRATASLSRRAAPSPLRAIVPARQSGLCASRRNALVRARRAGLSFRVNAIAGRTLAGWSPRARAAGHRARLLMQTAIRDVGGAALPSATSASPTRRFARSHSSRVGRCRWLALRRRFDRERRPVGPGQRGLDGAAAEATLHRQPSVIARRGAGPPSAMSASRTNARTPASTTGCSTGRTPASRRRHPPRAARPHLCCRPDASVRGLGSARLLLSSRRRGTGRLQGRHLDSCARRPWSVQAGRSGVDADRLCVGRSRILHAVAPASLSATGAIPVAGGAGTGTGLPKRRCR